MEISPPAGKSELLFFEPRPTQVQMIQGNWVDVRPMSSLETSGPLTFRLPAASEMVIDLSRTFLYLRCKILLKDGSSTVRPVISAATLTALRKTETDATAARVAAEGVLNSAKTAATTAQNAALTAVELQDSTPSPSNLTDRDAKQKAKTDADAKVTTETNNVDVAKNTETTAKNAVVTAEASNTAGDPNYRVAPVANFLHSMFSSVDLSLNGRSIVSSAGNYAYKSYISTILSASRDAINSQYENAMFYPDDEKEFDSVDRLENGSALFTKNDGLRKRFEATQGSKEFEVMDTLNIDLANQEKVLIPGINLVLTLRKNDPKFYLLSYEPNIEYKVDITEAVLYVRHIEVSSTFLIETERRLQVDTAKYYFQRVEVNVLPLAANTTVINEANLSLASPALPNRIVLGIVDTEAHLGSYSFNPFKFELHNLQSINFVFNGQSLPYRMIPFQRDPDGSTDKVEHWIMGYYSLFSQTGILNHPLGSSWISRAKWPHGYALIAFDFTPDGSVGDHLQISRGGDSIWKCDFLNPWLKAPLL